MTKLMMALAVGAAAMAGAALAQDVPGGGPRRGGMGMLRADANGDGVVTRAEYQAQVDQRFARIDANGNGKIDDDEEPLGGRGGRLRAATPPPAPPAGAEAAPSSPPPLPGRWAGQTRDQFRAAAMARFDRADTNHDGKIDQAEMAAMPMRGASPAAPAPQQ